MNPSSVPRTMEFVSIADEVILSVAKISGSLSCDLCRVVVMLVVVAVISKYRYFEKAVVPVCGGT